MTNLISWRSSSFNLQQEGTEVVTAKNGDEALDKAKKTDPI
jgi:CheY-like chemotaxis protein